MFQALLQRKQARFREQLYLQGIVASTVWNRGRTDSKQESFTPWDWVPEIDGDELPRTKQLRQNLLALFSMVRGGEKDILKIREKKIKQLTDMGYDDVERIFDEVFISWKVSAKEESQKAKK